MKTNTCLILYPITLLLFLIIPFTAYAESENIWTATVTESHSTCKNIGKDILGVYDLKIQYGEGNTFTALVMKSKLIFSGLVLEENPLKVKLKISYLEDAGIVAETVNITFSDEHNGTGDSHWFWSDGLMSCGGNFQLTVTK